MKLNKNFIIISTLLVANLSYGATFTVSNNFGTDSSNAILDNAGNALLAGDASVQLGTFADVSDVTSATNAATLFDSFQQFGNSGAFVTDLVPSIVTSEGGVFSLDTGGVDVSAGGFAGQDIYLVVSNNSNSNLADEFFVFQFADQFEAPDPDVPPVDTFLNLGGNAPTSGNVLIGRDLSTPTFSVSTGGTETLSFGTAVLVPEPSTSAILGLGGLAVLLRRRR